MLNTFKEKKLEEVTKELATKSAGYGFVTDESIISFEENILKPILSSLISDTYRAAMEEVENKFKSILENHCCKYGCRCEKKHLYCNFELDHGTELESVIEDIVSLKAQGEEEKKNERISQNRNIVC